MIELIGFRQEITSLNISDWTPDGDDVTRSQSKHDLRNVTGKKISSGGVELTRVQ